MERSSALSIERFDILLLLLLSILALMSVTKLYGLYMPIYIWIVPMLFCYNRPLISVFFLTISQLLPPSQGSSINLTQLFTIIWFVVNIKSVIDLPKIDFSQIRWVLVFLLLVIFRSVIVLDIDDFVEGLKILLVVIIIFIEINRIDYRKMVLPIIMATAVGAMGFYMYKYAHFDFIVNSDHLEFASFRGGVERFMIGNGDYNFYATYLLVGFSLSIGCILEYKLSDKIKVLALAIAVFFVFPILSTMSRGALITMILVLAFAVYRFLIEKNKFTHKILVLILVCVIVYMLSDSIWFYIDAFLSTNNESSIGEDVRFLLWKQYLDLFYDNSLWGVKGLVEMPQLAAHNTFVELLACYGFPIGMIFFYTVFLQSFIRLRCRNKDGSRMYLLPFLSVLSSFTSLSILGFKVFWILLLVILNRK